MAAVDAAAPAAPDHHAIFAATAFADLTSSGAISAAVFEAVTVDTHDWTCICSLAVTVTLQSGAMLPFCVRVLANATEF